METSFASARHAAGNDESELTKMSFARTCAVSMPVAALRSAFWSTFWRMSEKYLSVTKFVARRESLDGVKAARPEIDARAAARPWKAGFDAVWVAAVDPA